METNQQGSMNEIAVFAGGCFWCTEAVFEDLKGVVAVMPGYAGGHIEDPTYDQVCSGNTGHAEVIRIEYDPARISFDDLLTVFFATHNPTTPNQQGADIGTQYRSAVFYTTEAQKRDAEKFIAKLNTSGPKVVTEVAPLEKFYEAEEHHRKYYQNNSSQPYCQVVINPKLEKIKEKFHELLKESEEK